MSELPWEVVSGPWLKACKEKKGVSGWRRQAGRQAGGSDGRWGRKLGAFILGLDQGHVSRNGIPEGQSWGPGHALSYSKAVTGKASRQRSSVPLHPLPTSRTAKRLFLRRKYLLSTLKAGKYTKVERKNKSPVPLTR